MAIYTVAGMTIAIGAAVTQKPVVTAADFSATTWTNIQGWTTAGTIDGGNNIVTATLIGEDRDIALKGTRRNTQSDNEFAYVVDDPGQIALLAAGETRETFPFRITLNDAPAGGTPGLRYFTAMVTSGEERGGGANTVRMLGVSLLINSNTVRVAAAAGTP